MMAKERDDELVEELERQLRQWSWLRWAFAALSVCVLALATYATIEMQQETSALADAARQELGMYAILSDVRAAAYAQHAVGAALAICGMFWVALNWHRRVERAVLLLLKERKPESKSADA